MEDLIGSGHSPAADLIKDSTIETFAEDVMVASREVPVIVDFWATWCGPCKTLGPILEKAVTDLKGKVKLVKVDIDQNQMLAQQLRIQSVPTVMAFIAGQPVDGFAGALPESQIKTFLERILQIADQAGLGNGESGPSADDVLNAANEAFEAGDLGTASQLYGQLAQQLEDTDAAKANALAGLARCHLASGNAAEARQILDLVPEAFSGEQAVASAQAALELAETGSGGDLAAAEAAAQQAPDDMPAQFSLAEALIGSGQFERAADCLLGMIKKDREWNDDAARQQLLKLFDALGPTHSVTKDARRKLSSILFS